MKDYRHIHGWFDYKNTYDFLLSKTPDNGIFVECGAWLGKSSAYLCDSAQNRVNVYIVDTWEGSLSETDPTYIMAQNNDIYKMFLDNMGNRRFTPIRSLSENAVNQFDNDSCDVVFIDMTHTYEHVKKDIEIWFPKVKKYGYIAGHDYQRDWPDVVRAVNEFFGPQNLILMDTCWIYYKNE